MLKFYRIYKRALHLKRIVQVLLKSLVIVRQKAGVKAGDGQFVTGGSIHMRQEEQTSSWYKLLGIGKDDTLSKIDGVTKFGETRKENK